MASQACLMAHLEESRCFLQVMLDSIESALFKLKTFEHLIALFNRVNLRPEAKSRISPQSFALRI